MTIASSIRTLSLEAAPALLDEHGPIFILGCPRSGTTFLSTCIGAMPDIDEFVGRIAPPRLMHLIGQRRQKGLDCSQEMAVMRDIFWLCFLQRVHFFEERLGHSIKKLDRIGRIFKAQSVEGRRFCYKEPFAGFAIADIVAEFKTAKFIHIIRDGRDNADSLTRQYPDALSDAVLSDPVLANQQNSEIGAFDFVDGFVYPWWVKAEERDLFRQGPKYVRNVMLWTKLVGDTEAVLEGVPPVQVLKLKYETMVTHKLETAEQLAQFLDTRTTSAFLRQVKKAHAGSIGISKKNQSEADRAAASRLAGGLLTRLGYNV